MTGQITEVKLNAVIISVEGLNAHVLTCADLSLPSGPLGSGQPTFEQGLRSMIKLPLEYVEQLYTYGNLDATKKNHRTINISYVALARPEDAPKGYTWSSWYEHFPWEDCRAGVPSIVLNNILPAINDWKNETSNPQTKRQRSQRIELAFPREEKLWNEEYALQRYELLWEAGLVEESKNRASKKSPVFGKAMPNDHRRILATAISRLRAKIKYRPVVFEIMPEKFTLFQLQKVVEAIAGVLVHKQNFRRTIEDQKLIEKIGKMTQSSKGRPAELCVYRPEVLRERALAGTKLPRRA